MFQYTGPAIVVLRLQPGMQSDDGMPIVPHML